MPPYLTKPRWLIGHVLVLAIVVGCINLGFWQVRRLHQRKQHNAIVLRRSSRTTPLPESGWVLDGERDLAYRRVTLSGTYDPAHEVLVRFRSRLGLPGYEVVTPLVTDRGAVLVDRGWVPLALGDRWPSPDAAPLAGTVRVEGLLAPTESGSERAARAPNGQLVIGSINVDKLRRLLPYRTVYPVHLLVDGTSSGYPAPVEPPDLTEGPHFSYAVQWFSFASVGVIGWIFLLATRGRRPVGAEGEAKSDGDPAPSHPMSVQ